MTIPTTAFGIPIHAIPASTVGVRDFASPTTATSAATSNPTLMAVVLFERRRSVRILVVAFERKEVVAVPHRLDEDERAVEDQ